MFRKIYFIALLMLMLSACGQTQATPPKLQPIQLGVGYVPNVQFAPFYVAQAKGFFAEEGLDVSLEYGFETDFVALTAKGERQFAIASGDQVILSRAQGLPLVYVMKWYERFPVAIMTTKASGIDTPAKLIDHSVGIPGLFGASYIAWKALVYTQKLDETKIKLQSIGFTQAEAVSTGQVDAAVIYIANEPVQLKQQGMEVNLFEVSDYINLISNGLVTNETVIKEQPDLVRKMVRANLRGLQYTLDHPDEAMTLSRKFIPDMKEADVPTQRAVLEASLALWRSDQVGLTTEQAWQESVSFMRETGLLEKELDVIKLYTNEFVGQK